MKIRNILMAGALLLTACGEKEEVVNETITGPTTVKVVSVAITPDETKYTGDQAWKTRRPAVVAMVKQENPDVLCIQGTLWNQPIYLAQQLTDYAQVDYNVDGNNATTGYHNTIMYRTDKYTLVDEGRYWLGVQPKTATYPFSTKEEERRGCAYVILKSKETNATFLVGSTSMNGGDLDVDQDARVRSAQCNVDQLKEITGDNIPVILCGNMNASFAANDTRRESLTPYLDWMISVRDDAFSTDSEPSYNGFSTLPASARLTPDHIFAKGCKAKSFQTLTGTYGGVKYMSDHNPIKAELTF